MDKNLDYQGRWRSKTVAFRVSEEEGKLLNREVVVQGNPRVYKALRNQMAEIYEELMRLEQCGEVSDELLYTLQVVAETLNGLKGESPLLAEKHQTQQAELHFPSENKEDL